MARGRVKHGNVIKLDVCTQIPVASERKIVLFVFIITTRVVRSLSFLAGRVAMTVEYKKAFT